MARKSINISAHERNRKIADDNREFFKKNGLTVLNIIGSPGCGKTTILEYTAQHFSESFAVIVGDVKTALDSDRILQKGHRHAYAIETGGGCHLTPAMIQEKVSTLPVSEFKYLFIENVGNLVCPSSFDLGERKKIAVLSVPEGDEKVRKYPALFLRAAAVIINKTDLLGVLEYDIERVKKDCRAHNPGVEIFELSARTGDGFPAWFDYLKNLKIAENSKK